MRFAVSYEIVTPESADEGDFAESGMLDDTLSLRDALELVRETRTNAVDGVECVEPNEWPMHAPRWVTIHNGSEFETGARESRSLHFPDNLTPATRRRICRLARA